MLHARHGGELADLSMIAEAERSLDAIPPLWPLASSVAVNPFLGQLGEPLEMALARMERVAGVRLTMPRRWYAQRIADGRINDADLSAALDRSGPLDVDLAMLKQSTAVDRDPPVAFSTVADLAAQVVKTDWPGIVEDRMGTWASAFFDEGQAMWPLPRARGAYASWREQAQHDLTPEILGLRGFARFVADLPDEAGAAFNLAAARLGVGQAGFAAYGHRLLVTLGGWAQLARQRRWQAELGGASDRTQFELLVVRMMWEVALLERFADPLEDHWAAARMDYDQPIAPSEADRLDALLQDAAEIGGQRRLGATLGNEPAAPASAPAKWQAAFCIDVRSERFRRALEVADPAVRTLGFAGFFGLRAAHRRFGSDVVEQHLPVLLSPTVSSRSGGPGEEARELDDRTRARAARAWGRFKLAAVSSFAFVEAAGPMYVAKLVRDALGLSHRSGGVEPAPRFDPPLSSADRIATAEAVLRAMSLTRDFASLVLLVGHGAGVTNNPHASGLHCGACGGYAGDVNARLLAGLLNDPDVRLGLAERGLVVPAATRFVGALHDTTSDRVTIFADGAKPEQIGPIELSLTAAGRATRGERAASLPRARNETMVARRGKDWAEVRPEWGLAGCQAFIAAPRARTAGRNLAGRAFLHDYDWQEDEGFSTLELILTAPVVVASWISLQYYGSTVVPALFGGGNKLLHNVVGGVGVLEGNGGPIRAGLPWQSVHDGHDFVHDPLRLTVCIEAPGDAISAILERHDGVRALFENRWLSLFILDERGTLSSRYTGAGNWQACVPGEGGHE